MTPGLHINPTPDRVLLAYGHEEHSTAVHLHEALASFREIHAIGQVMRDQMRGSRVTCTSSGSNRVCSGIRNLHFFVLERASPGLSTLLSACTGGPSSGVPFAHAFLAQRRAVTTVRRVGGEASWLPLAAPDYLLPPFASFSKREFDAAFVGSVRPGSPRAQVLEHLCTRFNMAPYGRYQTPAEMMATYANARASSTSLCEMTSTCVPSRDRRLGPSS